MKKTLFVLLSLSISLSMMAQGTGKIKEIGLTFQNLNEFGLTYKTGTDKALWRFNTLLLSGTKNSQTEDSVKTESNNAGVSLIFGREYRKKLAQKLELRYGADLSFRYYTNKLENNETSSYSYNTTRKQYRYQPGINLVCGLNYLVNDQLAIGVEMLPNFSYTTGYIKSTTVNNGVTRNEKIDISGFNYGLSNGSVLLSVVYRLQ